MSSSTLTVGIVGAGVAGCSAALFVREALPHATIRVFEKRTEIGGRIQTRTFHGCTIETGASFFHSSNQRLTGLVGATGLEVVERQRLEPGEPNPVGVWDGKAFIVTLPGRRLTSALYLLSRYGLSLVRLRHLATDMLARWRRIYDLQDRAAAAAFASPADMLQALGLADWARESTYALLARHDIETAAVTEIVNSVTRSIYNQDARINGFAGMIALLGTGVIGGKTLSLAGGNSQLCERLLQRAGADVRTGSEIRAVRTRDSDGPGRAPDKVSIVDRAGDAGVYDAVIIAAPLTTDDADLDVGPEIASTIAARPDETQVTHVLCVAGQLSPRYFNVGTEAEIPKTILTVESNAIPFSTIDRHDLGPTSPERVYKIQSRTALDERVLRQFFDRISDMSSVEWAAYPTFTPAQALPGFRAGPSIYYVNAMESLASTLETEVVASRNVVGMLLADLTKEMS